MDTSLLTHTYLTFKSPKLKLKKQSSHKQLPPTPSTSLSFPKSTITPLLISQPPQTQTKQQALESVIKTIESSRNRGIVIDTEIYSSLLETCYQIQSITHGIKIHKLIPPTLLKNSVSLSSKVVRLYSSCGVIETAHRVFDEMSRRKVSAFPWNSLISGYTELGRFEDALALYFQMEEEGVEADQFTFPRVLKACAGYGCIRIGEAIYQSVVRCGFCRDVFILNALVDMYSKCGDTIPPPLAFT